MLSQQDIPKNQIQCEILKHCTKVKNPPNYMND